MRSDTLFPVLFAAGGLCNLHLQHAVVKSFTSRLKRDVRIDWGHPPTFDTNLVSEPTAWPWTMTCNPVEFKIRKEMAQPRPSKPTSTPYQPNVTIYYTPYMENSIINMGDDDITFSVEQSTTSIDSTTEGWQIGAQLTAGAESVALGISAGYSKSWTTGNYKTKAVSIHTTCKPGYDCRIETWTFHLKISGSCKLRPIIVCGAEIDACVGKFSRAPSNQFKAFGQKHCPSHPPNQPYKFEACEVNTPIFDQVGKPLTRLVRISEKIIPESDDNEATKALKAVAAEDGWYQLENGEWYDPKDDMYYGNNGDGWYSKPNMPKPDLSRFQEAAPARRGEVGSARGGVRRARSLVAARRRVEIVFLDKAGF
ncbi:hypothetical protein HRG_008970 [Hirsutella rhossiliensis]|uniref:Uncharacterized protein n=1 Tax=Hirsutella rhossiliensis TaxID=111463 RepID=A0A9P8MRR5_9HYPO|nr:uncharacterized protein HRG_08970 [Hirsutella rhossiliensis]KAH0959949.1 hypothetical protein HRG_08970 [Hirsutella rhossiliensis]